MDGGSVKNAGAIFDQATHVHKKGSNRKATPAELTGDYTLMQYEVSIQLSH